MSGPDQRHAVEVARDVVHRLPPGEPPRTVIAAALLHDVGKVESRLGTFARVGVTLAAMAAGRAKLLGWAQRATPRQRQSLRRRVGLYLAHDQVGAELLEAAGSEPLTSTWAREHHLPAERWSVERRFATALKAADDD